MKRGIYILLILLLANAAELKAQFESQVSQYWAIPNFYNPGYAGSSGKLDITAFGRLQWIGVEGAPRTTTILAEMPWNFLGKEHGVGAVVYNDRIGLFSSNVIALQYAYKLKVGKGTLNIGIQGGYISQSFNADSIHLVGDENAAGSLPTGKLSANSVDVGAGLYFYTKKVYVGLSAMHVVAPELELSERYRYKLPRSYYFTAGYNIQLNNPLLELHPSILVKSVEPDNIKVEGDSIEPVEKGNRLEAMWSQTQIDVSLRLVYNKMLWLGASWRGATFDRGESAVVMIGGKFKSFAVGYSFDYPLNLIGEGTWGSHELFLKYMLDLDNKKKKSKKHKSVRIL